MKRRKCNHENCNSIFPVSREDRVYCSKSCQVKANKMRRYNNDSEYNESQKLRAKNSYYNNSDYFQFELRDEYKSHRGMEVNIDDDITINIENELSFEDFKILIDNGYGFLFDFSKIKYKKFYKV